MLTSLNAFGTQANNAVLFLAVLTCRRYMGRPTPHRRLAETPMSIAEVSENDLGGKSLVRGRNQNDFGSGTTRCVLKGVALRQPVASKVYGYCRTGLMAAPFRRNANVKTVIGPSAGQNNGRGCVNIRVVRYVQHRRQHRLFVVWARFRAR